VVLCCWATLPRLPVAQADSTAAERAAESIQKLHWRGINSCASTACHNANGPRGSKGSEYSTWVTYDPHATRAFNVLTEERSRRIVRNLHDPKAPPPEKNDLCLSCHAVTLETVQRNPQAQVDEGVSCENCHGPAEKWLTQHYLPGWKEKKPEEKAELGMRPLNDLIYRAKLCVECHIGSPGRDVNHDLIAAGHPRLNFEYGAYLANIPKHWDENREKAENPGQEARVWAIGQVIGAKAALNLLANRAEDAKKPWPEFAEYDCYACHHELREPSWRQQRGYGERAPGTLVWESWYYTLLPRTVATRVPGGEAEASAALNKISQQMKKPFPPRKQVAQDARDASALLDPWLTALNQARYDDPKQLRQLLLRFQRSEEEAGSWDEATQDYLAAAALYNALSDLGQADPQLKAALQRARRHLDFPRHYDSPSNFVPEKSK
jgi:hypothetical protein